MKTLTSLAMTLLPALTAPAQEHQDPAAMAAAITAFGHDLQQHLPQDQNWCWSPASVAMALDLALLGARGDTAVELARTLHLVDADRRPWPPARAEKALRDLRSHLERAGGDDAEMNVVNDVWGQQGYAFLDSYRKTVADSGSTFRTLDFARKTEASRLAINAYIEEQTKDRIRDLIPRGGLTPETRQVLTNAVYFKGTWAEQFSRRGTRKRPFTLLGGDEITVPTMRLTKHFGYAATDDLQMVTMGFEGSHLRMAFLLPGEDNSLGATRAALSPSKWSQLVAKQSMKKVFVLLPRFEVRSSFGLTPILQKMGLSHSFSLRHADFSGVNGGAEPLAIDQVIHKTFLKVDEYGAEAAAATAVLKVGSAIRPADPIRFEANRPFLAVLYDTKTRLPLFVAQVADPRG